MSLTDLANKRGLSKPVTTWVEEWRASKGSITPEAIHKVTEVMKADFSSGRRSSGAGRLRPSMIGNPCPRAQVLSYLGLPSKDPVEIYVQMADAGSWLHYKWQAEGLSAGWLTDVEVQVEIPEWNLRGSVDGIMKDGTIFEAKTIGNEKFWGRRGGKGVMDWEGPKPEHVRQVDAYMFATGAKAASIVYINRDSNAFREFRVEWDQARFLELSDFVDSMLNHIEAKQLPVIQPGCLRVMNGDVVQNCTKAQVAEWSRTFDWCDYNEVCADAVFHGSHPLASEVAPWA